MGVTAEELNDLLHAHFIKPEDRLSDAGAGAVYLTEVTAPNGVRRADAVHVGLWQSRGAGRIDVCELKVTRADFRRELDKPEKAEAWWPYSSTFSIVAPSIEIAPPDELPPGWGLMVPQAGRRRFRVVVKPEERTPTLTVGLLLTLLKNTETTRINALREQQRKLYEQQREAVESVRRERGVVGSDLLRRLELMNKFEKAMGLELDAHPWGNQITPEAAAEGLTIFMKGQAAMEEARGRAESTVRELERLASSAQERANSLREAMRIQ